MTAQKAWIGKSEGARVVFDLAQGGEGGVEVGGWVRRQGCEGTD